MRIRHYIVTYNNEFQINETLTSLFSQTDNTMSYNLEVFIINNHSNFSIREEFQNKVTVFHNTLRPDFSTGHLSRNWNQALLNGFQDLNNPACDIVITSQDDTRFVKNYIPMVISLHEKFDLLQFGWGDNFVSYTANAVKYIGLWDERFCSIGYQEADYFLRALLYHGLKSSIQDWSHNRILNPVKECPLDIIPSGNARGEIYHHKASLHHTYNKKLFFKKWGINPDSPWTRSLLDNKKTPFIDSFIMYPYFEKDVLTLQLQKYLI